MRRKSRTLRGIGVVKSYNDGVRGSSGYVRLSHLGLLMSFLSCRLHRIGQCLCKS